MHTACQRSPFPAASRKLVCRSAYRSPRHTLVKQTYYRSLLLTNKHLLVNENLKEVLCRIKDCSFGCKQRQVRKPRWKSFFVPLCRWSSRNPLQMRGSPFVSANPSSASSTFFQMTQDATRISTEQLPKH